MSEPSDGLAADVLMEDDTEELFASSLIENTFTDDGSTPAEWAKICVQKIVDEDERHQLSPFCLEAAFGYDNEATAVSTDISTDAENGGMVDREQEAPSSPELPPLPILQSDVLLSVHRSYRTEGNRVYDDLVPVRSMALDVQECVKKHLHVALKKKFGDGCSEPIFWVPVEKVPIDEIRHWTTGLKRKFIVGAKGKCLECYGASDEYIRIENNRNSSR